MNIDYSARAYLQYWQWSLRECAGYFARNSVRILTAVVSAPDTISIWPPFRLEEDMERLDAIRAQLEFYLNDFSGGIYYYIQKAPLVLLQCEFNCDLASPALITIENAAAIKPREWRLTWRVKRPRRLPFRRYEYVIDERTGLQCVNEWGRLLAGLARCGKEAKTPFEFIPPPRLFKNCAVVASGPSSELFLKDSEQFETWIGANSVVLDKSLLACRTPFAICVIDPYYFSHHPSAATVRMSLIKLLETTSALLITSMDFYSLARKLFGPRSFSRLRFVRSSYRDCVGLKWGIGKNTLQIPRFGNVLTDLLVPISSSISEEIVFYGCDGRPPSGRGNYPKAKNLEVHEAMAWQELSEYYSEEALEKEFLRNDLYTRFAIDRSMRNGVRFAIRQRSWNLGLAHLPIVSEETDRHESDE